MQLARRGACAWSTCHCWPIKRQLITDLSTKRPTCLRIADVDVRKPIDASSRASGSRDSHARTHARVPFPGGRAGARTFPIHLPSHLSPRDEVELGRDPNAAAATAGGLKLHYYSKSCPRAEQIIKEQVKSHYDEHGNTAVSWLRALFHDCTVKSCDASLLLESNAATGLVSEQSSTRSFGMRNFKYIDDIKSALETACPGTVSCADLLALAARDGVAMLGGPADIPMRTGRRDATVSYYGEVERYLPVHNDTVSAVLSRFAPMGVDAEGVVALLGAHSVGRVHCFNLVSRLYPAVDGTIEPAYGAYLRERCPTADAVEDTRDVAYARNDRGTPMVIDNMYHKNLLKGRGLLLVDQRLATDPRTAPYVRKMAADNAYFHDRFAAALVKMSENGPLTGDQGEVRIQEGLQVRQQVS